MINSGKYTFRLRVANPNGDLIHSEDVREWGPVYEDLFFSAILEGRVPNNGAAPPATIEPLGSGERASGFRLSLNGLSKEYPLTILSDRVSQIVAEAMSAGEEKKPESPRDYNSGDYTWEVLVRENNAPARSRARVLREPYPLRDSPPAGIGAFGRGDAAALALSAGVARELRHVAATSTGCERAFLLGGWVVRQGSGVTVVADRAYPVETGVVATQTRIDFSAASFPSAMRELARSGEGRTAVGWAHNHPPPCGGPCPADVRACDADSVFFSVDDRVVHRCYFRAPYMVALVSGKGAGKRTDDPLQRAWGWDGGVIRSIEFTTFTEDGNG